MQQVTIDRTDLRVSRIAFGTASIHHLRSRSARQDVLQAAFDAGMTHFDTSPYYAYGLAEQELGRFIAARRDAVTVATKVGLYAPGWTPLGNLGVMARKVGGKLIRSFAAPRVDWTVDRARRSLGESLDRLRCDHIDLLLLHEPAPALLQADDFLAWLEDERRCGRIRHWGLAGESVEYRHWLEQDHPIAQVTQTHDSLEGAQAGPVLDAGRALQFTYGYLAAARGSGASIDAPALMHQALDRNRTGSVLVSSRSPDRVAQLAGAVS